jgi:hypothetical protein
VKRYVPLFAVLVLLLSACTIRFDIGIDVNADESGIFALFVGFDEQFQQLMEEGGGEGFDITEGLTDTPEGWTAEEVIEDGFEGARISTEFSDFDELNQKLAELNQEQGGGAGTDFLSDFSLTRDGDTFRFQADVSGIDEQLTGAVGESAGDDMLSGLDPATLFEDLFEIRFRLTLPGTVESHNADSVNGNELIWNVDVADEGTTYEAVSTTKAGAISLILIVGIVAILLVIALGVVAMQRRKRQTALDAIDAAWSDPGEPPANPIS